MLPTTWFYLSSLLILAVFFRFNRVWSVRNFDVLALISLTPGLVYIAMGSMFQGYLWLWIVGILIFCRLSFDVFLRRRPLLEPNLSFTGLVFSCVAASAFIIPNLFINRGDACDSPRAWRLEQIIAADEECERSFDVERWPGYRPFLLASQSVDKFFAPSQESWRRAVSETRLRSSEKHVVEFFGVTIELDEDSLKKKRSASRAVQWAAGVTRGPVFDFEDDSDESAIANRFGYAPNAPTSLNGLSAAPSVPVAPSAPPADEADAEEDYAPDELGPESEEAASELGAERRSELARNGAPGYVRSGPAPLTVEDFALILIVTALQLAVCAVIVLIGKYHFGSLQTGFACGLLYLLLPYINQFSARLDHIVPALMILLAVLLYRRPVFSGVALGIAGSLVFYPFLLAPLWFGYYWKKGAVRFALGFSASILTLAVALLFLTVDADWTYGEARASMFGRHSLFLADADGLWEYLQRYYRIPVIALFGVFCMGYALWNPNKNLATLISCSAALMLAVQFWMGRQGGLYMAWYLPLTVLTVFRPNLDDRTAVNAVTNV